MNIGQAAVVSGLTEKKIRYYEAIGLVHPERSGNGYRQFRGDHCQKLIFLARARSLGFSVSDCRRLLSLYEDRQRSSSDVRRIAQAHLKQLEDKKRLCVSLRSTLRELERRCAGDRRPNCPFIADLAGSERAPARTQEQED